MNVNKLIEKIQCRIEVLKEKKTETNSPLNREIISIQIGELYDVRMLIIDWLEEEIEEIERRQK